MLVDVHAHLWKGSYEENKKTILRLAEKYHVNRFYISSLGSLYPDKEEIAELNGATCAFIKEHPELISGYCYVNPSLENSLETLRRGIEDQGMSGMKLWVATFCDDPRVYPLAEKCIQYGIPILIHSFYKAVHQLKYESLGENVARLAARYPEAKILMAHLGANCYTQLKPVRYLKNVSVDISGSLYRKGEVDYAVKMLGVRRGLFGSDAPEANFLVSCGQVEESCLSEREKALIYGGNAVRLFDRSVPAGSISEKERK
ncbi:MAG TPA: hypothetical protein DD434_11930 [Bacteroidales bacterium]|nr:hypothetical protein [Bacteroidales bacterium]